MSKKPEYNETNKKIYCLLKKDLHRMRHEVAVTTRALRTQQGLFYADFKQKSGGFLSPQKVERLELERIKIPPLEVLVTLALAFGRRLRFSFVEPDEIETPTIPGSGWEAAARTNLYSDKGYVLGYWRENASNLFGITRGTGGGLKQYTPLRYRRGVFFRTFF